MCVCVCVCVCALTTAGFPSACFTFILGFAHKNALMETGNSLEKSPNISKVFTLERSGKVGVSTKGK